MAETFANDVPTGALQVNLDGAIDDTQTTITLDGMDGLPDAPEYRIRIDDELMLVTDDSAAPDVDVDRGIEGTTPDEHDDGAVVVHVLTAGVLETFRDGLLPDWWTVNSTPGSESVRFEGQVFVGAGTSTSVYGPSEVQIFDDGDTAPDDAYVEIFGTTVHPFLQFYNMDDRFDGNYPWLFFTTEYRDWDVPELGIDSLNLWYAMHTPEDKPAVAALTFSREGSTDEVSFGIRSESLSDATTGNEHFFLGGDTFAGNYPFRIYPFFNAVRWHFEELDSALLENSEFTMWLDDTPGATKVKFKAKDSGGTLRTAEVALT